MSPVHTSPPPLRSPVLDLGIVAHVDAGKTTLTEALLHAAGAIDQVGRVDHGNTTTDTDALERERGITIRAAVAAFRVGDRQVDLIDTPGHADFVAEVERALSVLDAAILVVSSVEGVQAHTRLLITALAALKMPFLIFVNKIDRQGAQHRELLVDLERVLPGRPMPLNQPSGLGDRPSIRPVDADHLAETLAGIDEVLLADFVADRWPPTPHRLQDRLQRAVRTLAVQPVIFGSALSGLGLPPLLEAVESVLPVPADTSGHPLAAEVFKQDRRAGRRPDAYVKVRSGRLTARTRIEVERVRDGVRERRTVLITGVRRFTAGAKTEAATAGPGDIALVSGLPDPRIGDQLGTNEESRQPARSAGIRRPTLQTVITTTGNDDHPADRSALHRALTELTAEDPLIDFRQYGADLTVSLYGEIQRQVIAERLHREYGIAADLTEPTTIYAEQVIGIGEASRSFRDTPFDAAVGFRIEPGPVDEPHQYRREIETGLLSRGFHVAIEQTVAESLRYGLFGWPVGGARVVLIYGSFSPGTSVGDFRLLVPLVLFAALTKARTRVCQPYSRAELDLPPDALGPVLTLLGQLDAYDQEPPLEGNRATLAALLPTAATRRLELALAGLTSGRGVLATRPDGHRPMPRPWPVRQRPAPDPADLNEYLRALRQR